MLMAPAEFHLTPAVDDRAEQFRGAFGVVDRRMRLARVPGLAGSLDGTAEHGLPVGKAGERDGVETAERMERTALVRRAPDRRVEEAEVERRVVSDQDRALAIVGAHRRTHRPEHEFQCFLLRHGAAQRMVRIDAGDLESPRVEFGPRECLDMGRDDRLRMQETFLVHAHADGRDLEQGMALAVEAAGLDVDDDRQETTKPVRHARGGSGDVHPRGIASRRAAQRMRSRLAAQTWSMPRLRSPLRSWRHAITASTAATSNRATPNFGNSMRNGTPSRAAASAHAAASSMPQADAGMRDRRASR